MYAFPKTLLFHKADFEALFKSGQRTFGSFFIVYSLPLQNAPSPAHLFGLVVGKKATGNNVKRNLVKRLIREAYRLHQHELAHLQVLVLAKRGLKDIDRKALRADLEHLLLHL